MNIRSLLKVYQFVDIVTRCKTFDHFVFVFKYSTFKVTRNPDIHHPVIFVSQQVYKVIFHFSMKSTPYVGQ